MHSDSDGLLTSRRQVVGGNFTTQGVRSSMPVKDQELEAENTNIAEDFGVYPLDDSVPTLDGAEKMEYTSTLGSSQKPKNG